MWEREANLYFVGYLWYNCFSCSLEILFQFSTGLARDRMSSCLLATGLDNWSLPQQPAGVKVRQGMLMRQCYGENYRVASKAASKRQP